MNLLQMILISWPVQVGGIVVLWLLLKILQIKLHLLPKQIAPIDLVSVLLFFPLHLLSLDAFGVSIVLYVIFGLGMCGILMTAFKAIFDGDIIIGKFMRQYWRILDCVLLISNFVLMIIVVIK